MRGRSASKATRWYRWKPLNVGLLNSTERGCSRASSPGVDEPGQTFWYEAPSKSTSDARHPALCARRPVAPLKQPTSSASGVPPSSVPAVVHAPPSLATAAQFSKCPISSENATLYPSAAHGTRVCPLDVEYIGWNAYGRLLHVVAVGSNTTWPNWFATLAVMEPVVWLVRSTMSTRNPAAVSCSATTSWSPAFMNRSVAGFGVNVSDVDSSGLAGACDLPLRVMNA